MRASIKLLGICSVFVAAGIVWLCQSPDPEVEVICEAISPNGKLKSIVETVNYGNHWLLNDAREEVRIAPNKRDGQQVVVYSAMPSGGANLAVTWIDSNHLEIRDTADPMQSAYKAPYPPIKLDYRVY
jgi:hypothetical protein